MIPLPIPITALSSYIRSVNYLNASEANFQVLDVRKRAKEKLEFDKCLRAAMKRFISHC